MKSPHRHDLIPSSLKDSFKCRLSKTEVRVVHHEVLNHNKLVELSRASHPSKWQKKNAALRNPDF